MLLGSPEKEAFKKRAKLQQENSEETDENEAEEVRTLATPPPMLPPMSLLGWKSPMTFLCGVGEGLWSAAG